MPSPERKPQHQHGDNVLAALSTDTPQRRKSTTLADKPSPKSTSSPAKPSYGPNHHMEKHRFSKAETLFHEKAHLAAVQIQKLTRKGSAKVRL